MRKISVKIEDGDSFEILVSGEISNIIINTTEGEYKLSKKDSVEKDFYHSRKSGKLTSEDLDNLFADKSFWNEEVETIRPKKSLGVKGESRFRK